METDTDTLRFIRRVMVFDGLMPENGKIPVGTIVVIPHPPGARAEELEIPPFTLIMAGQRVSRDMFPQLHAIYTQEGGFYEFILPNLIRKFLLGWDENGEPIMGSGCIYYENLPQDLLKAQFA